ncbi:hypothetical protein FD755_008028 [Muntiacus reevesi]|uniref:Zinc finger RING-H2-type domain-containing protein n=1 Tax=Muntiacus reevesi TaxID=9886 RepID=A0A5J5MJ80_MUNRE|nr:hypothetical protein FD755_008028 [Muntiacus reevesi]
MMDNCATCRNHIMVLCIQCQAKQSSATFEQSAVAWGVCNMLFTSLASLVGSEHSRCVHWTAKTRNSKSICTGKREFFH